MPDPRASAASLQNFPIEAAQRTAARIAGAILLVAMAASMLAELVGLHGLVISNDAAATARSLRQAEPLARLGAVSLLKCFIIDRGRAAAFYVILRPIDRGAAKRSRWPA